MNGYALRSWDRRGDGSAGRRYEASFHPKLEGYAAEGQELAELLSALDWSGLPGGGYVSVRGDHVALAEGSVEYAASLGGFGGLLEEFKFRWWLTQASAVLGEYRMVKVADEVEAACAIGVSRMASWGSADEPDLAIAYGSVGIVGYRAMTGRPELRMGDEVEVGGHLVALVMRYALQGQPIDIDIESQEFEITGATTGPPLGGFDAGRFITWRGAGDQCAFRDMGGGGRLDEADGEPGPDNGDDEVPGGFRWTLERAEGECLMGDDRYCSASDLPSWDRDTSAVIDGGEISGRGQLGWRPGVFCGSLGSATPVVDDVPVTVSGRIDGARLTMTLEFAPELNTECDDGGSVLNTDPDVYPGEARLQALVGFYAGLSSIDVEVDLGSGARRDPVEIELSGYRYVLTVTPQW